jgi:hypothetical protein
MNLDAYFRQAPFDFGKMTVKVRSRATTHTAYMWVDGNTDTVAEIEVDRMAEELCSLFIEHIPGKGDYVTDVDGNLWKIVKN